MMGNKQLNNQPLPNRCETCFKSFDVGGISRFWKSCTAGKSALVDRHICSTCSKLICNDCARRRKLVTLCRECCAKEEKKKLEMQHSGPSMRRTDDGPDRVLHLCPVEDHQSSPPTAVSTTPSVTAVLTDRVLNRQYDELYDELPNNPLQKALRQVMMVKAKLVSTEGRLMSSLQRESIRSWAVATLEHSQHDSQQRLWQHSMDRCRAAERRSFAMKLLRQVLGRVGSNCLRGSVSSWSAQCFREGSADIDEELDDLTVSLSQDFGVRLITRILASAQKAKLISSFGKWQLVVQASLAEEELDELTLTLTQHSGTRLMTAIFRRHENQNVLTAFIRWTALLMVRASRDEHA